MAVKSDRRVIIELSAEVSQLKAGLEQAQKQIENFKNSTQTQMTQLNNIFKKVVGFIALKQLFDNAREGVNAFASLQASALKLQNVFPTMQDSMLDWANTFSDATGIASSELIKFSNEVGDLVIGLGMPEEPASKLSQSLTQLAYDLAYANAGSVTLKDAQRDVMSAMVGEYEAVRKLGVAMNETTLQQTMFELGLQGTFQKLSESEKMVVRYATIWKQSQLSMGMSVKLSDTVIGWQARLDNALTRTKEVVGQALNPAFMSYAQLMVGFVLPVVQASMDTFNNFFQSVYNGGSALYVLAGILGLTAGIMFYKYIPSITASIMAIFGKVQAQAYEIQVEGMANAIKLKSVAVNGTLMATYMRLGLSIAFAISVMVILISLFKSVQKATQKSAKNVAEWINPKDLLKQVRTNKKLGNQMVKDNKNNAKKKTDIEKKVNDELNKLFKERVKAYANVGDFMKGVDNKVIGMNNIIKGAKSSVEAITTFNNSIDKLSKRLKTPEEVKFLDELKQLNPDEYAGYVRALANASDEELKEIVNLWKKRHGEAVKKAGEEVKAKAPEIRNEIKNSITVDEASLNKIGNSIGGDIATAIGSAFNDQKTQENIANMITNGTKTSLDEVKKSLLDAVKKIAWGGVAGAIIGAIIGAMVGGVSGAIAGSKLGATIGSSVGALFNLDGVSWVDKVKGWFNKLKDSVSKISWSSIGSTLLTSIMSGFGSTTVFEKLKNIFKSATKGLGDVLSPSFTSSFKAGINGLITSINKHISSVNNAVQNATLTRVLSYAGITVPKIPSIPYFAHGGVVDKATLGVFGEAGTEALIPLSSASKMKPFAQAVAQYLGNNGNGGVNITIEEMIVRNDTDIQRIAEELYNLERRNKRAIGVR